MNKKRIGASVAILAAALIGQAAFAACPVTHANLEAQLKAAQALGKVGNGGFGFNMWATVVDREGVVCAVARNGGKSRRSMACQPGYFCTESEHCKLS